MSMESQVNNVREIANIAGWTEMVWYWRTHLDVFIVDYLHVPLKDTQRVEARAISWLWQDMDLRHLLHRACNSISKKFYRGCFRHRAASDPHA